MNLQLITQPVEASDLAASTDILAALDPTPAALVSLTGLAKPRSNRVHLVSQVGFQDLDILPHWLAYYRAMGVQDVHLIIHGTWSERRVLASICHRHAVTVVQEQGGPYSDAPACEALTRLIQHFVGDWILLADADEFVELPLLSLQATIRALRGFGMTSLPSIMVQRVAADGSLPPVRRATDLAATFPFGNTLLIERMGGKIPPPWKSKYPLFLAHAGTVVRRGNHLAPDGLGISGFGLRAVTHHYKWRASLLSVLEARARNDPNSGHEKRVMADWLSAHDNRLPKEGAFLINRDELLRRGLLRRPTPTDIAMGVLLHRVRLGGIEKPPSLSQVRLSAKLAQFDAAWRRSSCAPSALPAPAPALAMQPAKIAIVAFRISPPEPTGGIATWVIAAAASLKRAGHAVTVIYVPFADQTFHQIDREIWASRGIEVVVLERRKDEFLCSNPSSIVGAKLMRMLEQRRFDLVHLHDAWGYGATLLAAKRQGTTLQSTRFVVTAHGPTDWYNRGNGLLRSELEFRCVHVERLQAADADHVVGPSACIIEWLGRVDYRLPERTYVHPNPLPHESWNDRREASGTQSSINRIVFFGRPEPAKGLALFCDAIDRLQDLTCCEFDLVLLGRMGNPHIAEYISIRTADWSCRTVHFGNWTSGDALLLLGEPGTLAVIPSLIDNFPYTVLQCLGAGIPFIATHVGGIPEMIHPEDRERVLVAPEPAAMAAALHRALNEGHAPARPAHDFATVELQWLAWHGSLLSAAPEPTIEAAGSDVELPVVVMGEQPAAWCLASLECQGGVRAEILVAGSGDGILAAGTANRLAARERDEFLVFCGPTVMAEGGAVAALVRAALHTGADAVVCAYREAKGPPALSAGTVSEEVIYPPCGPLSIAAVDNVFGGRFFLIRRTAFEALGGFRELTQLAGIEHRDLLNRLLIKGGQIVSVPYPLYVEYVAASELEGTWLSAKRACLEPFLDGAPRWLGDLVSWVQDSGWPSKDKQIDDIGWSIARAASRDRLARIRSGTPLARFSSITELIELEAGGDAEIKSEDGGLTVTAKGPDPLLLLPPLSTLPAAARVHVVVDITAPAPSEAQLFWPEVGNAGYAEARSVRTALTGGRQTIILSTSSIKAPGRLRFDPGLLPGQYKIFSVEIWARELATNRVADSAVAHRVDQIRVDPIDHGAVGIVANQRAALIDPMNLALAVVRRIASAGLVMSSIFAPRIRYSADKRDTHFPTISVEPATSAAIVHGLAARIASSQWSGKKSPNGKIRGIDVYSATDFFNALTFSAQQFKNIHGYVPNLAIPATFSEHIFARKFFAPLPTPSLGDKLAARDYAKARLGEPALPEVVWVGEHIEGLFTATLPVGRFVLKANNASGTNLVLDLPRDLSVQRAVIIEKAGAWLGTRFGFESGEWHYSTFPPRLFLERFIDFGGGEAPEDYKLFCFYGKAQVIQVDAQRYTAHKQGFFDLSWQQLPVRYAAFDPMPAGRMKPRNLEAIIQSAERLADGLEFARVDLYSDGVSVIKFGEITLTPQNANLRFSDPQFDRWLGRFFIRQVDH